MHPLVRQASGAYVHHEKVIQLALHIGSFSAVLYSWLHVVERTAGCICMVRCTARLSQVAEILYEIDNLESCYFNGYCAVRLGVRVSPRSVGFQRVAFY